MKLKTAASLFAATVFGMATLLLVIHAGITFTEEDRAKAGVFSLMFGGSVVMLAATWWRNES